MFASCPAPCFRPILGAGLSLSHLSEFWGPPQDKATREDSEDEDEDLLDDDSSSSDDDLNLEEDEDEDESADVSRFRVNTVKASDESEDEEDEDEDEDDTTTLSLAEDDSEDDEDEDEDSADKKGDERDPNSTTENLMGIFDEAVEVDHKLESLAAWAEEVDIEELTDDLRSLMEQLQPR